MKQLIAGLTLGLLLCGAQITWAQNLPIVNKEYKSFMLSMENYEDTPLIYGYAAMDANSKKLICFSSMTADVEDNPHGCKLGAYYSTDDINIEYVSVQGNWVELTFIDGDGGETSFYMNKKDVHFQE